MNKYINIISIIVMLFVSCRASKDFHRPETESQGSFRTLKNTPETDADTSSIAEIPWKDFFTEVQLQMLIDSVLARNYDMSLALKNIELNNEYLKQAKVAWLPSISVGSSGSVNGFSDNSLNGASGFNLNNTIGAKHIEDYSMSLGLSWEVDIWGKIKNQKAAALATWLQSSEAARYLQTRLITTTATSYYNLRMLHEQLEIAHKNLELNDSIVRIIQVQMENGAATVLAVQQAKVEQKTTASLIPELEQAIFIQENALAQLMSKQADGIHIKPQQDELKVPEKFLTGIPAKLISRRSDVRESEFALRAANARIGVAQASMYPALNISAATGLNAFKAGNWLSLPSSIFENAALGLAQPILNKRKLKTRLNISKIEYEKVSTDFRSKVLNAVTEVSDVLAKLEKTREKTQVAWEKQRILKMAAPNAILLFSNGNANYLEVITVQQKILQNELNLAELKRQLESNYAELYRSLGGGIK